jgi:C4-type Zn-finger protein
VSGMPFEHREYFEMEARAEAAEARVSELEGALRRIHETAIHIRNAGGRSLSPEATMIVREVGLALAADRTEERE